MRKLGLLIGIVFSLQASAQEEENLSFAVQEVAPNLYMLSGVGGFTGGNIGLSVGDDGVVMIDDSMPPMLDIMKQAIAEVTEAPVDFVINTHLHGDHTGNNANMAEAGAHILAHNNVRKRMSEQTTGDEPTPPAMLPVITLSEDMHFYLNGKEAHVFHVADAHTDGDLIIHFKGANVVHMGDVFFHGNFPFIDIDNGGGLGGYIAAQEQVLGLVDADTRIIPGHGPLANKADLETNIAMLKDCGAIIAPLVAAGKSEDEVVAMNPLQKYEEQYAWRFITAERMTRQVYRSLTMQ